MIIFLQQAKQPSMNICFLSLRRLRWIKILKVYFYYEYSWWGCQCRTGTGRDDCFNEKPTVSLIIGDSHSIGVPLAVSTDYSFIVPTATMIIHPVRMNGTLIGVQQTYDYFERISDRITSFIAAHSSVSKERVEEMMVDTTQLSKDLGTVLVGRQAVEEGLICEVGGISDALAKLDSLIDKQ